MQHICTDKRACVTPREETEREQGGERGGIRKIASHLISQAGRRMRRARPTDDEDDDDAAAAAASMYCA